ncbi:AraC family transcriptional regulator [Paenibacillus pectinilyticus]|uniref:AraC family transcriptional regulator n=1 Tax=Paenibacillus pectinilyticus TaxID=512399 RepID=A0A1C1A6D7_9BACL|nr:helix-turn-helix domain-containing protein [Paenibacillus pectinilyticus]OCT16061.1 AraC family transcriptional regulator [Paenibacillus pectinilyticus]
MNNLVSEWAESHFPLYTADSIHSLYSTSNLRLYKIKESLSVLLAIAGGKGMLRTEEQTYELVEGSVLLLPAHCLASLTADIQQPIHAYKLLISTREQERAMPAGAMIRKSEVLSNADVLFFPYEPAIVANVEELYVHRLPVSEVRHVQNQIKLHQIILQLLENQDEKLATSDQPSMERSIAYLENHYHEKITSEQLAAMAGVSRSHYSILFRKLTIFSPNEYLSRLRVHRAKELLMTGSGSLREIALKVGYKDEFYLSRRFKQHTGTSPSSYIHSEIQRVAVLGIPYASHLLLLGLEPAVTISDSGEYVNTAELEPQTMMFIDVNSSSEQVKTVLLQANTELIITPKEQLQEYGLDPGYLRVVAPILEISWMELGWKEHLRLIAQAIQKSERAEQWLAAFEKEEQAARLLVQQTAFAKEILTILVIKPEELLVYGARNVGYVMYQSLGLQPPAIIEQEMKKRGDQFHSIPIELSELEQYAGPQILVIIFQDEKGSIAHSESIFNSSYWKQLSAVQQNRVYHLDRDEWIPYNPVSIHLQLQRAVALFTGNQ